MSRTIISPATARGKPTTPPPRREQILVVAHGDGWLEVYGEQHIDVRIVTMPYVGTPSGEMAGEDYIDATLPECYRRIYWPGMRRASAMLERVRPSDLAMRDWELSLMLALDRARGATR